MSQWVNNPIHLSANNAGDSGDVTFSFDATTALTSAQVFITFPSGFDVTSVSNDAATSGQTVQMSSAIVAGFNSVTVMGVGNPSSAGGQGPFKIVTRASTDGQIVDANYSFGSVGIAAAAGSITNFGVAWEATTNSGEVNKTNQKVLFTFTIANDLWKHDMFVLTFPSQFTVSSSVTCASYVTVNTDINYYNSTAGAGSHTLDCKETAQTDSAAAGNTPVKTAQMVYIYGNANDIDISSTSVAGAAAHSGAENVKLEIGGITNPFAHFTTYTWAVKTQRFQTTTTIDKTTTSPSNPLTTTTGTIVTSTYKSTWGLDQTWITDAAVIFMDVDFNFANPVYNAGTAEVVLSDTTEVLPGAGSDAGTSTCWVREAYEYTTGSYTTCSAATSTISVANLASAGASSAFKMRIRATLASTTTNSKINSIVTKTDANHSIDNTTSGLATLSRSAAATVGTNLGYTGGNVASPAVQIGTGVVANASAPLLVAGGF